MYFIISFLCLLSFESFYEKNLVRKNVFLKKNKTSFISSWFLLHLFFLRAKTLFYFSNVLLIVCVCVFLVFFFCLVFSGVFHLFFFLNLSKQKIFSTTALSRNKFSFELFLRKEHILIQKRMRSKMIIRIFFKKKTSLQKKKRKNLFQDLHALRVPCAFETPLDHCCVSWRSWASKVYVHSVVIDLGRGHMLHQAISQLFSAFLFS